MHEYSIVQSLLERVDAEARQRGATAVQRLHVRIGEVSGVEVELLTTAFDVFREHSICANADLRIEPVAPSWACPRCERTIAPGDILRCPECGGPARLRSGDEIILDRIEMEVP